MTDTPKCFDM